MVTDLDEPLHVLISASNEETLKDAMDRVNEVFNQPDLARRLCQKYAVTLSFQYDNQKVADTPALNPVIATVGTIFDQDEMGGICGMCA